MKFALACDSSNVRSYFVQNGYVYTYDLKPYYRTHHIKNECLMGFWNYPVLFDGHFINLNEGLYPDIEFDIIFAAIEIDIKYLDILRKLYPTAKIVGTIKEAITDTIIRNQLIDNTDSFSVPYLTFDFFSVHKYHFPKVLYKIPQPINIKYLQDNFKIDKRNQIFDYNNTWVSGRMGNNQHVIDKLKYDSVMVSYEPNWEKFLRSWNASKYMINLDPSLNFGQQATQCAALGTVMIGGNNDSHRILYPELATCNVDIIIEKFIKMEMDTVYYQSIVDKALETLSSIYSFEAVSKQIQLISI